MSIEFPTLIDQIKSKGIRPMALYEQTFGEIPTSIKISLGKHFPQHWDSFDIALLEAIETNTPIADWESLVLGFMRLGE